MSSKEKRKAAKEKNRKDKRKKKKNLLNQQQNLSNLIWELQRSSSINKGSGCNIDTCKKILRIRDHPLALETLIEHYWNNGDIDEAYLYLKRLIEKSKPSPNHIFFLGEYYYLKNRYEESLSTFNDFLNLSINSNAYKIKSQTKEAKRKIAQLNKLIDHQNKYASIQDPFEKTNREDAPSKPSQASLFDEKQDSNIQSGRDLEIKGQKAGEVDEEYVSSPELKPQKIDVVIKVNDKNFIPTLTDPKVDDFKFYEKRLEFFHLRLLKDYDELLCIDNLPNVSKYWYQIETVKKILRDFKGRVLLADEVGLGKTIEACMGLKEFIMRGLVKKVLILTPSSLVLQWKEELTAKFDLDFITTEDVNTINNPDFWKDNNLVIASINVAKSRFNFNHVTAVEYDLVIVDEAHHLKNRTTVNWKLVNSLKKKFIFMLSATPVQNNLIELFNLITLLKPGILKTEAEFKKQYMKRGNPKVPLNKDKLKDLLREVMIRNTRSLIDIRLPKRFAVTIIINPSSIEEKIYAKLNEYINHAVQGEKKTNKMLLTTLLREAGSSPFALRDTVSKYKHNHPFLKEILELTQEIKETEKGNSLMRLLVKEEGKKIVFTQFKSTLNYLSDLLSQYKLPFSVFHGSLTADQKNRAIRTFKEEVPILLTTETGGEGRNIQFANTIINFDLPWNPMRIEQRIGRIHRIGQTRDVFIFNLCLKNSIEDFILDILDKKINMFELVIGEIDGILGNMDDSAEFSDIVFDLWSKASDPDTLKKSFSELGEKLVSARKSYQGTKVLDEALFEEDFVS